MDAKTIKESTIQLWRDWHGNNVNTIHNLMESIQTTYFCNKDGILTKITVECFYSEEIVREEYYLPTDQVIEYACFIRNTELGSEWRQIDTGVASIDWDLVAW